MKSILYGITLVLFLNACATYQSSMGNLNMPVPSVKSKIVGTATGTATAQYLFGIGGLNRKGLLLEAKNELQQRYPLAPAQIYTNTTVDIKRSFYFIYWTTKLTLTADILDYEPDLNKKWTDSLSQTRTKNTITLSDSISKVSTGDTIFCGFQKSTEKVKVVSIDKNNMITVAFWYKGKYKSRIVSSNVIVPLHPTPGCDAKATYKIGSKFWLVDNDPGHVISSIGTIKNVVGKLYLVEITVEGNKHLEIVTERFIKTQ